jgi:hypothetical protein
MKMIDSIWNISEEENDKIIYTSDNGYFLIRDGNLINLSYNEEEEIKDNEIVISKFQAPVTPTQFDSNVYKKINGELKSLDVDIPVVYLFRVDTLILALNKIIIKENEKLISENK